MDSIMELILGLVRLLAGSQPSAAMKVLEALIKSSPAIAKLINEMRQGVTDEGSPLVQELDRILAPGDEAGALLDP